MLFTNRLIIYARRIQLTLKFSIYILPNHSIESFLFFKIIFIIFQNNISEIALMSTAILSSSHDKNTITNKGRYLLVFRSDTVMLLLTV